MIKNIQPYIDELIDIIEHKLDKYINLSVIRYDIEHMAEPEKMSDYLIFTFNIGFVTQFHKVMIKIRIDSDLDLIFEYRDMVEEYTDTILKRAIDDLMKELKLFIFYKR